MQVLLRSWVRAFGSGLAAFVGWEFYVCLGVYFIHLPNVPPWLVPLRGSPLLWCGFFSAHDCLVLFEFEFSLGNILFETVWLKIK